MPIESDSHLKLERSRRSVGGTAERFLDKFSRILHPSDYADVCFGDSWNSAFGVLLTLGNMDLSRFDFVIDRLSLRACYFNAGGDYIWFAQRLVKVLWLKVEWL